MTTNSEHTTFLGVGIYTPAQAARLTGIRTQSIRRWARGYPYPSGTRRPPRPPVIETQLPRLDDELAISFLDLMEIRFIHAFRAYGVSLQAIRLAAERARGVLRSSHPFSTHSFKTDGKTIFAEIADDAEDPTLLDLIQSQYAFREVLAPYLYEGIDFEADSPARWRPMSGNRRIILDPERQFGQPIVERDGVRTEVLAAAFRTEQSVDRVARWFEIDSRSVRAAIEFEEFLDSRKAA